MLIFKDPIKLLLYSNVLTLANFVV